jgi:hypothetical protein
MSCNKYCQLFFFSEEEKLTPGENDLLEKIGSLKKKSRRLYLSPNGAHMDQDIFSFSIRNFEK